MHERRLETTLGAVDVEWVGYGRAGHDSLHPLDASLRPVGAEAVLKLRALGAGGDFDACRDFHEAREYERNHAQRYADGTPPPVTRPSSSPPPPQLRQVK